MRVVTFFVSSLTCVSWREFSPPGATLFVTLSTRQAAQAAGRLGRSFGGGVTAERGFIDSPVFCRQKQHSAARAGTGNVAVADWWSCRVQRAWKLGGERTNGSSFTQERKKSGASLIEVKRTLVNGQYKKVRPFLTASKSRGPKSWF